MRTGHKFCMYCGQAISEDAKFCPLCGKSQKIDRPEENEKQVPAAVQETAQTMTHTIKNTLSDVSQKVQEAFILFHGVFITPRLRFLSTYDILIFKGLYPK